MNYSVIKFTRVGTTLYVVNTGATIPCVTKEMVAEDLYSRQPVMVVA